jgi:hypothetical protein
MENAKRLIPCRLGVVEASPEKAGVGGSTPSLATIILKGLAELLVDLAGPLSGRFYH